MDEQHKQALAEGRLHGRVVRKYLDLLDLTKPRRGRKVDINAAQARIEELEDELSGTESSFDRLKAVQELDDLREKVKRVHDAEAALDQVADAEAAFIEIALTYSQHKHITKAAWREVGVPAEVLKAAGITATTVR